MQKYQGFLVSQSKNENYDHKGMKGIFKKKQHISVFSNEWKMDVALNGNQ